jgi:uncharacterized SAM-binding protein YcdF (DUF218 family)
LGVLLSKVLTQLAMPLGLASLLILSGIGLVLWRRPALGAVVTALGLAWVWLWSLPVVSQWLSGTLEQRNPPVPVASMLTADAIVVLGGGMDGVVPPRLLPDLGSAGDRVWHGARLFLAGKAPMVIVSGGRLPWRSEVPPEADAMLAFLQDLGVPAAHVRLEGHSGTTRGNAIETRQLADELGLSRLLLVTSALHMPRAVATFRAAGLDVIPAATDYEVVTREGLSVLDVLPDAGALSSSGRALKEYLGMLVYWLRGWA